MQQLPSQSPASKAYTMPILVTISSPFVTIYGYKIFTKSTCRIDAQRSLSGHHNSADKLIHCQKLPSSRTYEVTNQTVNSRISFDACGSCSSCAPPWVRTQLTSNTRHKRNPVEP